MIYQLSQVSNRDTQVLYFYRILRHSNTELNQLYRYNKPEVYQLNTYRQTTIDEEIWYEYILDSSEVSDRIPYLEFQSEDESELKAIEDLVEVETTRTNIIVRGRTNRLTDKTTVFVYWVPSLAYIQRLQEQIRKLLEELGIRLESDRKKIQKLGVSSDYVMNVDGLVPNLVAIGEDDTGYIYDDSHYQLSGSLMEQLLLNPPQSLVSSLLKSHTGTLTIKDTHKSSKVYQGFYGGSMCISGNYETLVLKDITSIIFLTGIAADKVVIKNCSAVIFRELLQSEGISNQVQQLDVLNSYLTIYQQINIDSIWIYQKSTVVLKKGTIHEIGWLEAGSTLVQDKPGISNKIEILKITPLQGLFYATSTPEEQPYLDEIFLEHKPISFQRGQVEDPIPIKEAIVHIYLKHSGKPEPSPTPSGKVYSPFTDWYWSGDSRVVQLIAQTHTDGKGYGGESLPKLREVQTEIETEGTQHNIMLWWGVNGLSYGASSYADIYKSIANDVGSNAMVFVGTVGHCPDGTGSGKVDGGGGQDLVTFNAEIEQFNADLVTALTGVSNIYVLDIAKYVKELEADKGAAWLTNDNLHYKPEASQMIYDWVCSQITNQQGGDFPDAPTDTNAGRIWNWFKYAGIPNVSDRPELIAGIIGNCQQESYMSIDLLGHNGRYYGPWCESNEGFSLAIINAGYTFHTYTINPGDDSSAIPDIFNWLTQQSDSWVNWLANVIDQVANQTGEAGARAYAELFCVCVERCVGGSDSVIDAGVYQIMTSYYGGAAYQYQDLGNRRDNAANIYNQFMGG